MSGAGRLQALRDACRAALADLDEADRRARHHPELSPLAWHLGHVFFVESYWVQEVVLGRDDQTRSWHTLYFPELCPKGERPARLPDGEALLAWTREMAAANDACWPETGAHPLLRDGYLRRFLAQHYAQHLETMRLARRQIRMRDASTVPPAPLTEARPPAAEAVDIPAAGIDLGGTGEDAVYDNEHPVHRRRIPGCRIAAAPVTNAEWLAFMADGGYRRPELWTPAGHDWLATAGARAPEHWRPHPDGGWYSADPEDALSPDAPVHGICAHEADAFARWAGARLPHEHEWESAARQGHLAGDGRVWEWCGNALYPYPGFTAFPYEGYSTPWFDGAHRVLRGASRLTEPEIRRPSFRNFYPEGHRHVVAGLRLAWDAAP
ncbi:hypothetical protein PC39_04347 [Salinisphaera sp. PC39]|uniref:SUMF1/EgtB/PvdO family nonheme iron enzyme n=1 Tax=Salinisphaera sp. PC39 TaxID=1304156 RepID=UPI0033400469